MVKLRYLGKRYQQFIDDLAENNADVSNILIVLDGASSSELNAVTSDISGATNKTVQVTKGIDESKLTQLFAEGQDTREILLFDEADALFGKRSEMKGPHDRYSKDELSGFLEAIEKYDDIVILASSRRRVLGSEFLAKVNVLILFPPFS